MLGEGDSVEALHILCNCCMISSLSWSVFIIVDRPSATSYGFIMRKEVENLGDLSAKDVAAPKFFNLLDLEAVPVGDVVKGYLLVQWDGI